MTSDTVELKYEMQSKQRNISRVRGKEVWGAEAENKLQRKAKGQESQRGLYLSTMSLPCENQ